jgi:outer membrane PBP1 activator LpoA protein
MNPRRTLTVLALAVALAGCGANAAQQATATYNKAHAAYEKAHSAYERIACRNINRADANPLVPKSVVEDNINKAGALCRRYGVMLALPSG